MGEGVRREGQESRQQLVLCGSIVEGHFAGTGAAGVGSGFDIVVVAVAAAGVIHTSDIDAADFGAVDGRWKQQQGVRHR